MKYLIPQAYHKYFCYCVSPQFSTVWNTTQANLLNSIVKFFSNLKVIEALILNPSWLPVLLL